MPPTTAELIPDEILGELINHDDIDLTDLEAPQGIARERVRAALIGRANTGEIDDAVLVADELIGNAVQHAGGPISLMLDIYENGAVVGVLDRGTEIDVVGFQPAPGPDDLDGGGEAVDIDDVPENGRGIFIIALLSTAWMVRKAKGGKVVVAVFVLTGGGL
ncbi:ATP-binding protein (plasmid) [Streptosporangium sp. CA-135522]|uniref:ATP-binding protein n=1 Tax=Streptosporangium sp. CA-135522 TaxID=3240072 RepID=UPI003D911571